MKLLKIALFCATMVVALPAQAAMVTLDLGRNSVPDFRDGIIDSGDHVTVGDFTMTFQNVRTKSQDWAGPSGSGEGLSNFFDNTITTVDLIFNTNTVIDTYTIGFSNAGATTFQLSGTNGTSGLNSLQSRGTSVFDMGTIPVFLADETYTLTHNVDTRTVARIKSLGLSSPPPAVIPLPAALPLLLAGLGVFGLLRRRARSTKDR